MCMKTGQQCPGPLEGPIIVDMTTKAKHGMQKRKQKPDDKIMRFDIQATAYRLTVPCISQRAVIGEAFYARLLVFFPCEGEEEDIRNRWTWLQHLPQISTDGSSEALILALQATASAFCAAERADIALKRYAWNLYGSALVAHRSSFQQSETGKQVTVHMISTSVMFSLFEAIQATTADAYRAHIHGAAKMLEITGPGQCKMGVLCQLFFHVRTQMAFVQLASKEAQSPVSTEEILYKVLLYKETPLFHRLMNCVVSLVDINVDLQANGMLDSTGLEALRFIQEEIGSLWTEYNRRVTAFLQPRNLKYHNAFTALTVSYFSSARILLGILAHPLTSSEGDDCAIILGCSTYLLTHENGCAYMRMAMPLLLVALNAMEVCQQTEAIGIFERWKTGSMAGISAPALKAINDK
jgi:hypothetical protein